MVTTGNVDIVVTQQFPYAQLFGRVVFHNQQPFAARHRVGFDAGQHYSQFLGRRRLGHKRKCAAGQPVVAVFIESQHLNGNMPGGWVLLQMVEHSPAQHIGQKNIQRHSGRVELAGKGKRLDFPARPSGP